MKTPGNTSGILVRVYLQLVLAALALFSLYHVLHAFYLADSAFARGKWGLAIVCGGALLLLSLWSALVIRRARTLLILSRSDQDDMQDVSKA